MDTNLVNRTLPDVLDERFTQYAFMSLEDRALPDARDGLKPSQRRVLVAMHDLRLTPDGRTEKCAKICGTTSGDYHPHGESIVYPTLCRMVQPSALRYPLLLGQGNFGGLEGAKVAAMRYTEAKLSVYGEAMVSELKSRCVPYMPNYNEKLEEPQILPSSIPNLLINGCEGIAVGWATRMLPHNLREVVDAIKAYIQNPKITPEEIMTIMPGPDFPTGGRVVGQSGVLDYYKTGHGTITLEGEWKVEEHKGKRQIVIHNVPYQSTAEQLHEDIGKLVDGEENKLPGLTDAINATSAHGVNIILELSKDANPDLIINKLLKFTCLRKTFTVNSTVLIDGKVFPNTPITTLIKTFVDHRKTILTTKFTSERDSSQKRVHILEGLLGITDKIDAVIAIIRKSNSPEDAEQALIQKKFVQSLEQAKAVLAITLRQLTKLENDKLLTEKNNLNERIAWLSKILGSEKELLKVVVKEQEEIAKKIGDSRRSAVTANAVQNIVEEDLVPDEDLIVSLTGDGYVRSTPVKEYRVQGRGGTGSKATNKQSEENITELFELGSKDYVLFFTTAGLCYQRRAFDIPKNAKTGKGFHVSNLLNLSQGEHVTNMVALPAMDQEGYLVIVTKYGYIKKTPISEYNTTRKQAGIKGVNLESGDEVAFAFLSHGNKDIFIVTAYGKCVRYNEDIIPIQGRGTRGSMAIRLEDNDHIVQVMPLDPESAPNIFVVTTQGFGKKSSSDEYKTLNSRNVKGYAVMNRKNLEKIGQLAGACCLESKDDTLLVMTSSGKCIRLESEDIRNTGRTTTGVKIIDLDKLDTVIKVAKISQEKN